MWTGGVDDRCLKSTSVSTWQESFSFNKGRTFIHQSSAAGYISHTIKPVTYGQIAQSAYASQQTRVEWQSAERRHYYTS